MSNKKENLANPIERAGFSGFLAPNRHWLGGIEVVSGESVCSNTNKLSILAIDVQKSGPETLVSSTQMYQDFNFSDFRLFLV